MEAWPYKRAVYKAMTTVSLQEAVCAWVSALSNGDDAGSSDDCDAEDDGVSLESWRAEPG